MFRKLVSNLPFSPALVGQLGFYARRLRKEELTRRVGLFMTVMALIVQSFVVFVPATSANGSDSNDMCPGISRDSAGVKKIKACYENNTRHYRDVMNYFGVSKTELWKALDNSGAWRNTTTYKNWYTFGHDARSIDVKNYSSAVAGTLYARKWKNTIQTRQWGWKGQSGETEFIILADCGNLALKRLLNPSAACVSLTASKRDISAGDSITLTAKATTDDGAEIAGYNFTQAGPVSDKTTVKTDDESATWKRTLSTAGTYKYTVSIDTTNNKDKITAKTCTETVTVTEKNIEKPSITIKKTVNDSEHATVAVGETFTYKVEVTNNGNVALKNAVVTDTAPQQVTLLTASAGKISGKTWTNTIASLAARESVTYTITAKYAVYASGTHTNSVCVDTPSITGAPDACDDATTSTDQIGNPDVVLNKVADNKTQNGINATTAKANGGDVIVYTITATNSGKAAGEVTLDDNLTDTLEYATLTDNGGGTFDQNTNVLSWGRVSLKSGEKTSRTFVMTVKDPVPAMAQNQGTPTSYDCTMSNIVRPDGEDAINIPVACPAAKEIVEQTVVKQLPSTGPGENMVFAGALLMVVSFLWARSRQLGKEVRLVRKDFSAGSL